jgi:chemotaxis protein CheD
MEQYSAAADEEEARTIDVGIAEYAVTDDGAEISTHGLGSCVAVVLLEPTAAVVGLAHVMLPSAKTAEGDDPAKFADTAIRAMLVEMEELGADPSKVVAKLAGGSEMFEFTGIAEGVGDRNVEAVRRELASRDIPVQSEDVGGDHGRTVRVEGDTGRVVLETAQDGRVEL